MRRNIVLLALLQALVMTVVSLVLSVSALVAAQLSSTHWATLPLALQSLATLLTLYPAARLMARLGRRAVFCAAALVGALGLACAAWGIQSGSFALFAAAGLPIGVFATIGQYCRFAAADAAPPAQKGLAISLTLSGGLLAALLGPMLARLTQHALAADFLASFLALFALALLAALLATALRLPPMANLQTQPSAQAAHLAIKRQPRLALAVLAGVCSYAVMNLLMSATPLAMLCSRFDFAQTATVIQWHLLAMFAPSLVSALLMRRLRILPLMLLGCLLNLASIATALGGDQLAHFEFGLILLGVGWNFLYIGATALLTHHCGKQDAAGIQALNDTLVFAAVTLATLLAAPAVNHLGWPMLNLHAALPIVILTMIILHQLLARRD